MIKIYFTYFEQQWSEKFLKDSLLLLPDLERIKVMKFRRWQDRQSSILGKLLLKHGLKCTGSSKTIFDVTKLENAKPIINDGPFFNISHSGNYVVCILSNNYPVGIDIEEQNLINIKDFKSIFTINEWAIIQEQNEQNQLSLFYDYWTKKEAVIKADGKGLSIPLTHLDSSKNPIKCQDKDWFIKSIEINNNYKCSVATPLMEEFLIEKVDTFNLL